MNHTEQYLHFLRYCVAEETLADEMWLDMDWEGLYDFSVKQAITGVVFSGIEQLGKEAGIPKKLLIRWYVESEQIRRRNSLLDQVAVEVYQKFVEDGFRSCILKGQGNARMYKDPGLRTPGDIDIWIEGSRKEILEYVRKSSPKAHFQYHHVDYPPVRGVKIEVHFIPSFFNNPIRNKRMQRFFKQHADEQFNHFCKLSGEGLVSVPTDSFNCVYQLAHIMRHLLDEGIGLRQLLDYYYLLNNGMTEEDRLHAVESIQRLGMEKFAAAVMYVLQRLFGLEENLMLVFPDDRLGRVVLDEILHTGNFGQHEDRFAHHSNTGRGFALTWMQRMPRLVRYFPAETLWRPLFLVWHFFWKMRHK